jgi:tRNA threonylcarbamoyladenosine modification (KEOPS) complex Cgi121 subunit
LTLHFFKEFNFYAEITGFKNICSEQATTYLKNNRKTEQQNVWIQFFNSNLIATNEHLHFAVLNALYAFKHQTNLSKSLAMETLLYASTQHQIQKAIQTIGLKPNMAEMAVTIISENKQQITNTLNDLSNNLHAEPCDTVLDLTPQKTSQIQQTFNITPSMIEAATKNKKTDLALANLIIEKVALLATKL